MDRKVLGNLCPNLDLELAYGKTVFSSMFMISLQSSRKLKRPLKRPKGEKGPKVHLPRRRKRLQQNPRKLST